MLVTRRAVAEGIGAVVPAALVLGPGDAHHALAVHVGLELRGLAELPEEEAADGRVKPGVGEVARR